MKGFASRLWCAIWHMWHLAATRDARRETTRRWPFTSLLSAVKYCQSDPPPSTAVKRGMPRHRVLHNSRDLKRKKKRTFLCVVHNNVTLTAVFGFGWLSKIREFACSNRLEPGFWDSCTHPHHQPLYVMKKHERVKRQPSASNIF